MSAEPTVFESLAFELGLATDLHKGDLPMLALVLVLRLALELALRLALELSLRLALELALRLALELALRLALELSPEFDRGRVKFAFVGGT